MASMGSGLTHLADAGPTCMPVTLAVMLGLNHLLSVSYVMHDMRYMIRYNDDDADA
jgi:hypothetical protein